jgi:small subunit ribosomal protein S29
MSATQRAAARLRAVMLAARAGTSTPQQAAAHCRAAGVATTTSPNAAAAAATAAAAAAEAAPSTDTAAATPASSSSVFVPRRSAALTGHDVGLYYPIDPPRLLPEALRALHQAGYAPRPPALARRAGCRALQQELEATSDAAALGGGGGGAGKQQQQQGGKKQQQQGGAGAAAASASSSSSSSGASPLLLLSARPPALMYRRCVHDLRQALEQGSGPSRLLLDGPAGCGKSLALAALVEWARQQQQPGGGGEATAAASASASAAAAGWVALYVPSAAALTSGGFFEPRAGDEEGTYDTLLSAQAVLRGAAEAHADVLARMPRRWAGGPHAAEAAATTTTTAAEHEEAVRAAEEAAGVPRGDKATLMDLVDAGLRADVDEARRAVECVLALVRELGRAASLRAAGVGGGDGASSSSPLPRVLIAVDDYNCLHWTTGYGRTVFVEGKGGGGTPTGAGPAGTRRYSYRTPLAVEQLNLARGLRLMNAGGPGHNGATTSVSSAALTPLLLGPHARVVAATTASRGVGAAADAATAAEAGAGRYAVPRLSEAEVAHALHYYYERGLLGCPPSAAEVRKMAALTAGNGAELRRLALEVTAVDAADGFA